MEDAAHLEWESFKFAFMDTFFTLETSEKKFLEFMILVQRNMSLKECFLRFTQLSKYVSSIVAKYMVRMIKLILGVFELVLKECHKNMFLHDMYISRLIVHAQHIEKEKHKKRSRVIKKSRMGDGNISHSRCTGYGIPRYKQRFSSKGSSSAPKFNKERVCNPKP